MKAINVMARVICPIPRWGYCSCLRLKVSKGWDCSRCHSAWSSVRWRRCRCTVGGVVEVAEIFVDVRTFCLSRTVQARRKNRDMGIMDLGRKTWGKTQIRRGKARKLVEKKGGEARSTSHTQNSRIKSNKTSTHQQIKKMGLFLVGIFGLGRKTTKLG